MFALQFRLINPSLGSVPQLEMLSRLMTCSAVSLGMGEQCIVKELCISGQQVRLEEISYPFCWRTSAATAWDHILHSLHWLSLLIQGIQISADLFQATSSTLQSVLTHLSWSLLSPWWTRIPAADTLLSFTAHIPLFKKLATITYKLFLQVWTLWDNWLHAESPDTGFGHLAWSWRGTSQGKWRL